MGSHMTRVLDILETPRHPHEVITERLLELACREPMPDPRAVPFNVPTVSKARWHTILSGVVLVTFLGLIWWALLSVGGAG